MLTLVVKLNSWTLKFRKKMIQLLYHCTKEILISLERKAKFEKYELGPNFLESIFSLMALKV